MGKIRMVFGEIDPQLFRFWLSIESMKECMQKKLETTILFIEFSRAFERWNKYFKHLFSPPFLSIIGQDYVLRISVERKLFYAKKGKKKTIPRRNYYGWTLRRWSCVSSKYTMVKLNLCCIGWNRQQGALNSTLIQIKQSSCILNNWVSSPH